MINMDSIIHSSVRCIFLRIRRCFMNITKSAPGSLCAERELYTEAKFEVGILSAGVLLSIILIAYSHSVGANECIGEILKMETGKIRISGSDGKSIRIDSSDMAMPLCVLEVVADRPQYKVYIPDGEWKGEWLIKRRKVMEIDGALKVDCVPSIVATVKTKDTNLGGTRASGEEPCN